jgi:ferredoxin
MSLVHAVTGEHSRLRRWTMYVFARWIEMPLLAWSYQLLRGRHRRLGKNRLVRTIVRETIAAPFGTLGDNAYPLPLPEVLRLIDELEGPIAVGPCRCRTAHGGCDHPLETDLVIRTGVEAWTRAFPHEYRLIDKQQAREIVSECHRLRMWQMVFVHCPVNQENEYVICNCCRCGCMPYILQRDLGPRAHSVRPGPFRAYTNAEGCTGHGGCVEACPFDARKLENGRIRLVSRCLGCGMCVDACPEGAIKMQGVTIDE